MAERPTAGARGARKPAARTHRRRASAVIVDATLCTSCGLCVAFCPTTVFERDGEGAPVVARLGDCSVCRFCEQHCPDFAITVYEAGGADDPEGGA